MKIWYSISADGMGHVVRSEQLINELSKKYEIYITCDEPGYSYLKNKYKKVIRITQPKFSYKNNNSRNIVSLIKLLRDVPKNTFCMIKTYKKIKPDLIISDFEPAASWAGLLFNKKVISVCNNYEFKVCEHDMKIFPKYWWMGFALKFWNPKINHFFISSFAKSKPCKKNVTLIDPIVRDIKKKKEKDFVLVYQTSNTNHKIIPELKKLKKVIVYGMKHKKIKGIEFKQFSKEFLKDLAECKYVIINGGFTVISEAINLNKPILANPISGQLEQEFNGYLINKLNIGKSMETIDAKEFEKNLPIYKKNIEKIPKYKTNYEELINLIERI